MNTKSQTIAEMFDRIAPTYDFLNRFLSGGTDQKWRKKAISYLPQKSSLNILDLCAGTLDLTLAALQARTDTSVTAFDLSPLMLEKGREKIPSDLQSRLQIIVGDGLDLSRFPVNTFDAVLCGFGMRNLGHNAEVLQQLSRILKNSGRVIVLDFFRPTKTLGKLFYSTYGRWMIPLLGRWISKDREAYDYFFQSIQSYHTDEEFCALLQREKFQLISNLSLSRGVAHLIIGEKR